MVASHFKLLSVIYMFPATLPFSIFSSVLCIMMNQINDQMHLFNRINNPFWHYQEGIYLKTTDVGSTNWSLELYIILHIIIYYVILL